MKYLMNRFFVNPFFSALNLSESILTRDSSVWNKPKYKKMLPKLYDKQH